MQKRKSRVYLTWTVIILLWVVLATLSHKIFGQRQYYISLTIMAASLIIGMFVTYEKSGNDALKLSLLSVMCALCIVGRVAFAAIPVIKPMAAIVIITGIALGPRSGFAAGSLSMLISNFMFGQGPWTIWQMLSFGLIGLISGILFYAREKYQNKWLIAVFGSLFYLFVAGPILDLSGVFGYFVPTKNSVFAILAAGFPINLTASVTTFICLVILAPSLLKKLRRVMIKNGIR